MYYIIQNQIQNKQQVNIQLDETCPNSPYILNSYVIKVIIIV